MAEKLMRLLKKSETGQSPERPEIVEEVLLAIPIVAKRGEFDARVVKIISLKVKINLDKEYFFENRQRVALSLIQLVPTTENALKTFVELSSMGTQE